MIRIKPKDDFEYELIRQELIKKNYLDEEDMSDEGVENEINREADKQFRAKFGREYNS